MTALLGPARSGRPQFAVTVALFFLSLADVGVPFLSLMTISGSWPEKELISGSCRPFSSHSQECSLV